MSDEVGENKSGQEPLQEEDHTSLLLHLELQLMDPAFRRNRKAVSALLAADFREFGSSGRIWSRETILDLLATEDYPSAPAVEDFALQLLAPDTALVTYRTIRAEQSTLRSSIWKHNQIGWQVLFHQGTKQPHS